MRNDSGGAVAGGPWRSLVHLPPGHRAVPDLRFDRQACTPTLARTRLRQRGQGASKSTGYKFHQKHPLPHTPMEVADVPWHAAANGNMNMKKRFDRLGAAMPGKQPRPARSMLAPALAALSMLAACGGGGDGSGGDEAGGAPSGLQGYWRTYSGAMPVVAAFVVPDDNGTQTAWLLVRSYNQLIKAVVRSDLSASGTAYFLYNLVSCHA